MPEPDSRLTRERPDIWRRAMALATRQTRVQYLPKLPLADGTIYACGGGGGGLDYRGGWGVPTPPAPKTPEDLVRDEIARIEQDVVDIDQAIERREIKIGEHQQDIETLKIQRAKKEEELSKKRLLAASVFVPEGAMEWLLHEVGHYLAADPAERLLPNYGARSEEWGIGAEREWQAWAFEEIVLWPWGPARMFAPPSQRDGAAFKPGPMPSWALGDMDRKIREGHVDIEEWRALYGEWISWNPRGWDSVM